MPDSDTIDSTNMSDDELVTRSITYGYKHHYPGRIRIGDILQRGFGCDWRRIDIIRQKIVYYGIARYADSDETDLLIGVNGANAIDSGKPIAYMKKWREDQKPKPSIYANNSVVGDGNRGISLTQGSFREGSSNHTLITTNTNPQAAQPKNDDQKTSSLNIWQKIYKWTDHKTISIIIGGLLALSGSWLLKWIMKLLH